MVANGAIMKWELCFISNWKVTWLKHSEGSQSGLIQKVGKVSNVTLLPISSWAAHSPVLFNFFRIFPSSPSPPLLPIFMGGISFWQPTYSLISQQLTFLPCILSIIAANVLAWHPTRMPAPWTAQYFLFFHPLSPLIIVSTPIFISKEIHNFAFFHYTLPISAWNNCILILITLILYMD